MSFYHGNHWESSRTYHELKENLRRIGRMYEVIIGTNVCRQFVSARMNNGTHFSNFSADLTNDESVERLLSAVIETAKRWEKEKENDMNNCIETREKHINMLKDEVFKIRRENYEGIDCQLSIYGNSAEIRLTNKHRHYCFKIYDLTSSVEVRHALEKLQEGIHWMIYITTSNPYMPTGFIGGKIPERVQDGFQPSHYLIDELCDMAWRKQKRQAEITKVIFNDPATIVFWDDGKKTVVKAQGEPFDPEKGLAMAISKRVLGNQGNYYNEFKKWLPEEEEVESLYPSVVFDGADFIESLKDFCIPFVDFMISGKADQAVKERLNAIYGKKQEKSATPQDCRNCKHKDSPLDEDPCTSCHDLQTGVFRCWEPENK